MHPINLLIAINLFVSLTSNWSAAKKGFKSNFTAVREKPSSYLQKIPPNISAVVLVLIIVGIFGPGNLPGEIIKNYTIIQYTGLIFFLIFSWLQVYSYRSLGKFYSQDVLIYKEHKLITGGLYKTIRHPQYLFQVLSDLGAGLALMNYIVIPIVLIIELPLFIMRAKFEEKLLLKHFSEDYKEYKKKSGFLIPFIG